MHSLGARMNLLAAGAAARLGRVNVGMLPNEKRLGRPEEFAAP
jgi:hypothetical protein